MESVGLDMNDLFDVADDDDIGAVAAPMPNLDMDMPMMEDEQQGQDEGEVDSEVLAKLRDIKGGAAKKRVMRPQPKLDPTRLNGERGLPILTKTFQGIKFKGKGHEINDLKLMMTKLEHWAHRLFPKMTFDEVISRIEKLGAKREVQTTLKRIRLDMPLSDDDIASEPVGTDDTGATGHNEDNDEGMMDAEAAYDEMVRQEREALAKQQQEEDQEPKSTSSQLYDGFTSPPAQNPPEPPLTPSIPAGHSIAASTHSQGMTPEQKDRLEKNKLRALEKRAARLGVPVSSLMPNKPTEEKSVDNSNESQSNPLEPNGCSINGFGNNYSEKQIISDNPDLEVQYRNNSQSGLEDNNKVNSQNEDHNNRESTHPLDVDMQTEDEILASLNFDMEEDENMTIEHSTHNNSNETVNVEKLDRTDTSVNSSQTEGNNMRQIKMCSEPIMDIGNVDKETSEQVEIGLSSDVRSAEFQKVTNNEEIIAETTNIEVTTNTGEGDMVFEESKTPTLTENALNEVRKNSAEGDDLQLHLSESDTTNTTQEEDTNTTQEEEDIEIITKDVSNT